MKPPRRRSWLLRRRRYRRWGKMDRDMLENKQTVRAGSPRHLFQHNRQNDFSQWHQITSSPGPFSTIGAPTPMLEKGGHLLLLNHHRSSPFLYQAPLSIIGVGAPIMERGRFAALRQFHSEMVTCGEPRGEVLKRVNFAEFVGTDGCPRPEQVIGVPNQGAETAPLRPARPGIRDSGRVGIPTRRSRKRGFFQTNG